MTFATKNTLGLYNSLKLYHFDEDMPPRKNFICNRLISRYF